MSEEVTVVKVYAFIVRGKAWLNVCTCHSESRETDSLLLIFIFPG